ncbi:MAG TPA: SurA N-terminal domain-containing protein [Terriglobales bacterium]|nr:SurA N-terminal domain-containing protein [Terriglobales bacterium]
MTRSRFIIVVMAALCLPAFAGDLIDRIVATVNRDAILQSDWDDEVRYEAFVGGRSLEHVTNEDRKSALDRLIDQALLREQTRFANASPAPAKEIEKRISEIRRQYSGADTPEGWTGVLRSYGLTAQDLRERVAAQMELMQMVEARLRPSVSIDAKSIESYYNQELLPQLRQAGAQDVPLAEVTPQIKELLTQKKMNQMLTAWLQNLRAGSEIHTAAPESQGIAR